MPEQGMLTTSATVALASNLVFPKEHCSRRQRRAAQGEAGGRHRGRVQVPPPWPPLLPAASRVQALHEQACPRWYPPTFSKPRPTVSPVALPPWVVLEKSAFLSWVAVQGVLGQPRGGDVPGQMAPVDSLADTGGPGRGVGGPGWARGHALSGGSSGRHWPSWEVRAACPAMLRAGSHNRPVRQTESKAHLG